MAKHQATCTEGGLGRAHRERTWDGPKRDTSPEAQKDADEHNKKDSSKMCAAVVFRVDEEETGLAQSPDEGGHTRDTTLRLNAAEWNALSDDGREEIRQRLIAGGFLQQAGIIVPDSDVGNEAAAAVAARYLGCSQCGKRCDDPCFADSVEKCSKMFTNCSVCDHPATQHSLIDK